MDVDPDKVSSIGVWTLDPDSGRWVLEGRYGVEVAKELQLSIQIQGYACRLSHVKPTV